jgi:hypothetical protein
MATKITSEDIEYELARRRFSSFLAYVKVLEPPPGRAVLDFQLWPHLLEVCDLLLGRRLLVWLKARQIGASWLLAAYALWIAMYQTGAVVLMFSQGELEAKKLLDKCKFIYERLPDSLKATLGTNNSTQMEFPDKLSSITVLPSTEKAGRGDTATLIVYDEAERHEHMEASYSAVKPTIDDTGGQLIMVSTANPDSQDSTFRTTFTEAPANGYTPIFYAWNVRPSRDDEWYEARKSEYPDKARFSKEYPNTADEALAPPEELMAFDLHTLDEMQAYVMAPVEKKGAVNIYQKYVVGGIYMAGTDSSHGVGKDDAVTVVMDRVTGLVVADIVSSLITPDWLAEESVELLKRYGNPVWNIEDNDWGIQVISKAKDLHYPHLFYRPAKNWLSNRRDSTAAPRVRPGWHTNNATRFVVWGDLIEAIYARQVRIMNKDGLGQFYTVIRNPDKAGRIEARKGAKDDYPMAVGLAWQMRNRARRSTSLSIGSDTERDQDRLPGAPYGTIFKW